jgi:hypothetical protein
MKDLAAIGRKLAGQPLALGVLGVVLAWVNSGFSVGGADQQLYIPYIKHFANPALYGHDYIFAGDNYSATAFVPLMGTLYAKTGANIRVLMGVGLVLTLWLWFSAMATVVSKVGGWRAMLWTTIFCSWEIPIPGSAVNIWHSALHPRCVAMTACLWSLAFLLHRRHVLAAASATVGFLFHPLIGIAGLLGLLTASTAFGRRAAAKVAIAIALFVGVSRLIWSAQSPHLPLLRAAWWDEVAVGAYLWYQSWPISIFVSFAFWLFVVFFIWSRLGRTGLSDELKGVVRYGLISLPLLLVAFLGMKIHSPLLVSLQLHRGFFAFEYLAIVSIAVYLEQSLNAGTLPATVFWSTPFVVFTQALMTVVPTILAAIVSTLVNWRAWAKPAVRYALPALVIACVGVRFRPHRVGWNDFQGHPSSADWLTLQEWARSHTASQSLFLTPPDLTPDFRVYSDRSVVLGNQDGSPTIFNQEMAAEFGHRRKVYEAYRQGDCATILRTASEFHAQLVVFDKACDGATLVHEQGKLRVYALDPSAVVSAP